MSVYDEDTKLEGHVHVVPTSAGDDDGGPVKQTNRHLLPRHIQLIALSGAIGTGLYVSAPRTTRRCVADSS